MHIRHLVAAATVGLVVITGAGCSTAQSTADPVPEPNNRVVHETFDIRGTGYSYNVPRRWGAPKADTPGFDPDSMAIARRDRDGFTDNVNVVLLSGRLPTPQQTAASATRELRSAGARRVSARGRVRVDGVVSPHVRATLSMNNTSYTIDQFYLTKGQQHLVVTFSFSTGVRPAARGRVIGTVLGSWRWTR